VSILRIEEPTAEPPATPRRGRVAWALHHMRDSYVQIFAGQLLSGVVALGANVMMARALSPTGRGEVALMLQIVYLSTQVLLLGTERSFVAGFHGAAPAAAVRAYARLLVVPCTLGLFAVTTFVLLAPERYDPGPTLVALVASYAVVDAIILASRAVSLVIGRVHDFLRCRLIESVAVVAIMLALFFGHVTSPGVWVFAYLIAGAVPTGIYIAFWLRLPTTAAARPVTVAQRRLARREGLTLFPAAISNMAMLRVDRLALPILASTAGLGLYTSVATMTELLAWPLRAFADSRLGKWRAAHHDGGLRVRPLVIAAVVYTVVVAPILAAGIYVLIVPVFGARYAPAKEVVLPLVAAAGLYAISRVSLGVLVAKGHSGYVSAAEICGFAVSFVGYVLLIPHYGILGAAYGSLVGYGACLVFAIVVSRFAERGAAATPVPAEPARLAGETGVGRAP